MIEGNESKPWGGPYDEIAFARLQAAGSWKVEPEVLRFLAAVALHAPRPDRVIEFGSYRMHDHNPLPTWDHSPEWIGVDSRPGPGVDLVSLAHEADIDAADVILSISALEHDPHWRQTVYSAVRLVRPGGIVALSCTGPGWIEHEEDCAPGGPYYGNVDICELVAMIEVSARSYGRVAEITSWYDERNIRPHWPRSNVIARVRMQIPE